MPYSWPTLGPGILLTVSCHICGAVTGVKYGESPNPTDGTDLHREWHRENGDLHE